MGFFKHIFSKIPPVDVPQTATGRNGNSRHACRLLRLPGLIFVLLALAQTACNVTKHLDTAKGERLLIRNKLEIKGDRKLSYNKRSELTYALEPYFKLKPNRRPLITFRTPWRLWWYYRSINPTKKFDRWIMKKVAEPPALYQESLAKQTALNFKNQMRQRGYFEAESSYDTDSIGRYKVVTSYRVDLGPLYTIDTVRFESRDSLVRQILLLTAEDTRLRRGNPVNGSAFDAEKIRVTAELKNRGYAYFSPSFVEFEGDSVGTRTNVVVRVLPPTDTSVHKIYVINRVAVLLSLLPDVSSIRSDTTINGIYFATAEPKFQVKPKHLHRAIAIRPDWPYRQVDFDKTLRDLNALGIFRFVAIKPYLDSLQPDRMNVDISFTPTKRLAFGADLGLSSSTSSLSGRLLGASVSSLFRNRNLFRGAEQLETNVQLNLEFDIAGRDRPPSAIFSQEFKIQNGLLIPRFFDYLGIWRGLHDLKFGRTRLVSTSLYERMNTDGKAHFSLNYNFLKLIDFYRYNLFNAAFGYEIRTNPEHQYSFDHVGIDVLRPQLDSQFLDIFQNNQFLRNSFNNQLFTGFLLRSFSYTYAGKNNLFGERWLFRVNTDLSGLETMVLNQLWSIPFGKQEWRIGTLEFSKYIRADLDAVYTRDFNKNLTGVARIGSGIVQPFGDTRTAPYVKQFFVGGPSGLRAWRIRELGPGGFYDPESVRPFYQSGDFRFEFNGELRFPIFYIFKGAIFVDGGNIWNLKPDPVRPQAELRWDSYKNIAIGTGAGVRMDITFAVLRVDAGLPLRNPYSDDRGRHWVPNRFSRLQLRDFNFNIAVGYPF